MRIPDTFDGRPQRPGRRLHVGARAAGRARRAAWRQPVAGHLRRASRPLGDDDARRRCARSREGTYSYVDYLDNDGIELDKRIRIEVAVTIDGRRDALRLHRHVSPQVRGPFNCVPSGASPPPVSPCAPSPTRRSSRPMAAASARSRCICRRAARQSARAGAGQCAHRHHQAHHRLHPRRACEALPERVPADAAGELLASCLRRPPSATARRSSPAS